ncbi:alpha/beta fold hydrolase [Flavihumibacter petaseus]|uniref:Putative hydrolase n=1 Tax=Flavihumibacter petaseus NBRC 106054 TaxID=1220578 RepID=A0A0E9N6U6_9BACT|nr:alpha/beta hydrolase [Flavihumibacter petaseus]GAO45416.1 putative hydrolase [Flavihumibacter petaseus NBRC 106054]
MNTIHYRTIDVNGVSVFYRESGDRLNPHILLLHGYPSSSFMFRNLMPVLGEDYHVIAPDLPGFGFSAVPDSGEFAYTFENLTAVLQKFIDLLQLDRFSVYLFDYGAPIGLRLAMANPDRIGGIISQNGNAYEEGLSNGWNPIQKYWRDPNPANRNELRKFMTAEFTAYQYREGVADQTLIAPDGIELDQHFLDRPGNIEIQLDLLKDYISNVLLYPSFHRYLKEYQPPFLAVWGNRDPYFLPVGAEAYKKDLPNATIKFFDTGHFALETHFEEIGREILQFLQKEVDAVEEISH